MLDRIRCALGYHQWVGWSMISNGKHTGAQWCFVCNVAWGKPANWNRDNQ